MAIQRQGPGNSYFRQQLENQETNQSIKKGLTKKEVETEQLVSKFTLRDLDLPVSVPILIVFFGIIGVIIYALFS